MHEPRKKKHRVDNAKREEAMRLFDSVSMNEHMKFTVASAAAAAVALAA